MNSRERRHPARDIRQNLKRDHLNSYKLESVRLCFPFYSGDNTALAGRFSAFTSRKQVRVTNTHLHPTFVQ